MHNGRCVGSPYSPPARVHRHASCSERRDAVLDVRNLEGRKEKMFFNLRIDKKTCAHTRSPPLRNTSLLLGPHSISVAHCLCVSVALYEYSGLIKSMDVRPRRGIQINWVVCRIGKAPRPPLPGPPSPAPLEVGGLSPVSGWSGRWRRPGPPCPPAQRAGRWSP